MNKLIERLRAAWWCLTAKRFLGMRVDVGEDSNGYHIRTNLSEEAVTIAFVVVANRCYDIIRGKNDALAEAMNILDGDF